MGFKKDINGLRAIAVISVVIFHFNGYWLPGGFAGVDIFFVISGYLMTSIVMRRLDKDTFSLKTFYIARINRIVPALLMLSVALFIFGYFFLAPIQFEELAKHILSSIHFVSNIVYWRESGYFEATSQGKWLLHTWSLSTEWQFYIVYPLYLMVLRKFLSPTKLKITFLLITFIGFIFGALASYIWLNPAYYLLPTRAWEFLCGGLIYLYPLKVHSHYKKHFEILGLLLIITTYLFVSELAPWPGYLAILPVLGSLLVIQANRQNSIFTSNRCFQLIGRWSYSIYLWHWPIVVAIYYYSLPTVYNYLGIALSILLGFLSYRYIETIKFCNTLQNVKNYFRYKPLSTYVTLTSLSIYIIVSNGLFADSSNQYKDTIARIYSNSPHHSCIIHSYQDPELGCEFNGSPITWALLGDSHAGILSNALSKKLATNNIGLKQFTFSGCPVSYLESHEFNSCSRWYNDTIQYILDHDNIQNVVLNHRYTNEFFGGNALNYPDRNEASLLITENIIRTTKHFEQLLNVLAANKDKVYVFYPIPELPRDIDLLVGKLYKSNSDLENIKGTTLAWYEKRNEYIINYIDSVEFPKNVFFLDPRNVFCDTKNCFAVKDGMPLYIDNNHPSNLAAAKLINLIPF